MSAHWRNARTLRAAVIRCKSEDAALSLLNEYKRRCEKYAWKSSRSPNYPQWLEKIISENICPQSAERASARRIVESRGVRILHVLIERCNSEDTARVLINEYKRNQRQKGERS